MKDFKNKIILLFGSLYTVDDIREDEGKIIVSKLESDSQAEEILINDLDVDLYDAREQAVEIMNEIKYYENVVEKQTDNPVT